MRKLLFIAAIAIIIPDAASAATWVAVCSDGQRLQYNQTVGGKGLLYLGATSGGVGNLQMAVLTQTTLTDTKICATVNGNSPIPGPVPLSQICADRRAGEVTLKWQSPMPGTTLKEGHFCKATVTVN